MLSKKKSEPHGPLFFAPVSAGLSAGVRPQS